ncbi:MAG: M23 family metallopeptidase [Actinobacteria bacterium]|nr:M23 family metallopeptidase [Actinomycetota bacterium]
MKPMILVFVALTALVLGGPAAMATVGLLAVANDAATRSQCGPGGPAALPLDDLPAEVAGYTGDQLANAAAIMRAGVPLNVGLHGQTVAVMTAMGESTLINVDYGDTAGPDSRGLFQQRANGAWGTYADRMDPQTAATNFYQALLQVEGWETLPPTIAAHRVQRNADPDHYSPYWDDAVAVVDALAGTTPGAGTVAESATASWCGPTAGMVTAQGWTNPAVGKVTSPYGTRVHPVTGLIGTHTGLDLANRCGTPIRAAAAGVVLRAAPGPYQGRTGNQIIIDHGGQVTTRYGHVLTGTMTVRPGDVVSAGMPIAAMGGDPDLDPTGAGSSTGCHLHFEVNLSGKAVDPSAYLLAQGVVLGTD